MHSAEANSNRSRGQLPGGQRSFVQINDQLNKQVRFEPASECVCCARSFRYYSRY